MTKHHCSRFFMLRERYGKWRVKEEKEAKEIVDSQVSDFHAIFKQLNIDMQQSKTSQDRNPAFEDPNKEFFCTLQRELNICLTCTLLSIWMLVLMLLLRYVIPLSQQGCPLIIDSITYTFTLILCATLANLLINKLVEQTQ